MATRGPDQAAVGAARNAAGTCFYENLFDGPELVDVVIPWLSNFVVENSQELWRERTAIEEIHKKLKALAKDPKVKVPRNVYQNRKIESL